MTQAATSLGGINPQPRTQADNITNWQRLSTILAAGGLSPSGGIVVGMTSLALTGASPIFTIGGSPATVASPVLTLTAINQAANTFLAGPTTGAAAAPTFRSPVPLDLAASPGEGTVLLSHTDGSLTWGTASTGSGGTVSSVGLSAPVQFTVTGSPVIAAGTLGFAWVNQTANTFLAGPASGAVAAPTFRGLAANDFATGGSARTGGHAGRHR